MTNVERTGLRDLTISAWHRRTFDDDASAFDVDLVGMCRRCDNHLYAWEVTRAHTKATTWSAKTALRLNVPGYLITYDTDEAGDFTEFVTVQVYPEWRAIGGESDMALHIKQLRRAHAYIWHGDR